MSARDSSGLAPGPIPRHSEPAFVCRDRRARAGSDRTRRAKQTVAAHTSRSRPGPRSLSAAVQAELHSGAARRHVQQLHATADQAHDQLPSTHAPSQTCTYPHNCVRRTTAAGFFIGIESCMRYRPYAIVSSSVSQVPHPPTFASQDSWRMPEVQRCRGDPFPLAASDLPARASAPRISAPVLHPRHLSIRKLLPRTYRYSGLTYSVR